MSVDVRAAAGVTAALVALAATVGSAQTTEADLQDRIDRDHPGSVWASREEVAGWLAANPSPVLLDVRRADEFAVSHLSGARRVRPGALTPPTVPAARTVIAYCSVGWRSAAVVEQLRAAGHPRVFNMAGGIFGWARDGRPMVRRGPDGGVRPATRVHPFDATWGRLLPDRLRSDR